MVVKEFRITMPFSLAEYKKGQRYSTARSSRQASTGSDGIELLEKKSFVSEVTGKEGVYTHKIYHLDGYVPGWIKAICPASALRLEEKAWDAYPHCKTVVSSPFLGDKFLFTIESQHAEFDPNATIQQPKTPVKNEKKSKNGPPKNPRENELPYHPNILNLDAATLKKREIHYMDIATEEITDPKFRLPEEDPKQVGSDKSKLQPLKKDWQYDNYQKMREKKPDTFPLMCCYKVVTVKCKIFGIANKVENYLMSTENNIFLRFHKQIFCWMNDWWDMSDEQILEYETSMFEEIGKALNEAKPANGEAQLNNTPGSEQKIEIDLEKLKLAGIEIDEEENSKCSSLSSSSNDVSDSVMEIPVGKQEDVALTPVVQHSNS